MKKHIFFLASCALLLGCDQKKPPVSCEPKKTALSVLDKSSLVWPSHFSYDRLMCLIREGDLKGASKYVNVALQISPQSAPLHLVNGFIYEEMARTGDDSRKELVGVAYRSAVRHDPTQWVSSYLLGASELKDLNYEEAQENLANALLLNPNDPDILYSLAYASYYLRDIPVALSSIKKAVSLCGDSPAIVRAAVIVFSAAGNFQKACEYLKTYEKLVGSQEDDVKIVQKRVDEWRSIHDRARIYRATTEQMAEGVIAYGKGKIDTSDFDDFQKKVSDTADADSNQSVIIDCYLLRTSETESSSKGNNVFEQLAVSLGTSPVVPQGATGAIASFQRQISYTGGNVARAWARGFSYAISPIALTYGLNIMNATQTCIEVIGRPTIATLVGKPAYFLQGDQYTGASSGAVTGAVTSSIDAGMKIEVLPRELTPQGILVLEVNLTGSQFPQGALPNMGIGASNQLFYVARSKVQTIVKAHLGQTVMVGCMYSRKNISEKSGFPILQDIPGVQYFFAKGTTSSDTECILYLLTPSRGGSSSEKVRAKKQISVASRLKQRGLMSLGEYSTTYYILKRLNQSEMIRGFRSGDLPAPFWGYHSVSINKKLQQICSFLWF